MALPRDLQGLGLGGLLSGGITNQLGQQSAQFQRGYQQHREAQMEQLRTAFAVDTRLIERGRDYEGRLRYEIESQIARHKREVEKHMMDALMYGSAATTGKIQIHDSSDSLTWRPKSIREQLQREIDEWLAPVKL